MRVQLLYARGCPNVTKVRDLVRRCLQQVGLDAVIEELEGNYPSPTVRVDGADVMGEASTPAPSCRLDLPSEARLVAIFEAKVAAGSNRGPAHVSVGAVHQSPKRRNEP